MLSVEFGDEMRLVFAGGLGFVSFSFPFFLFSTLTFFFHYRFNLWTRFALCSLLDYVFPPSFLLFFFFFFFFLQCARWWTRSAVLKRTLHSDFDVANVLGR